MTVPPALLLWVLRGRNGERTRTREAQQGLVAASAGAAAAAAAAPLLRQRRGARVCAAGWLVASSCDELACTLSHHAATLKCTLV
jgi:hypothetical protein